MTTPSISRIYLRITDAYARIAPLAWFAVSLALLAAVAIVNPAKLGVYGWLVCKLTMAASLGYLFDRSAFSDACPANLEGIERAMAQTRRGTIIAATLIATGLMP